MAAAQAPVPHERVSPTPRSWTRIATWPGRSAGRARRWCRGEVRVGPGRAREVEGVEVDLLGEGDDGVGVAEVDRQGGVGVAVADVHQRVETVALGRREVGQPPGPEVHRPAVPDGADRLGPGPGGDDEVVGRLEPLAAQVLGEHAGAVAAHLRRRAVGVAVVHEPLRLRRLRAHGRLVGGLGGDHPDHTVSPDAGPAVREPRHACRRQAESAVEVGHQDEVVLGPVPFVNASRSAM